MRFDSLSKLMCVFGLAVLQVPACGFCSGVPKQIDPIRDPLVDYCNNVTGHDESVWSKLTTDSVVFRLDVPIGDSGSTVTLLGSSTDYYDRNGRFLVAYVPTNNGFRRFTQASAGADIQVRFGSYAVRKAPSDPAGRNYLLAGRRKGIDGYYVRNGDLKVMEVVPETQPEEETPTPQTADVDGESSVATELAAGVHEFDGSELYPVERIYWDDLPMTPESREASRRSEEFISNWMKQREMLKSRK